MSVVILSVVLLSAIASSADAAAQRWLPSGCPDYRKEQMAVFCMRKEGEEDQQCNDKKPCPKGQLCCDGICPGSKLCMPDYSQCPYTGEEAGPCAKRSACPAEGCKNGQVCCPSPCGGALACHTPRRPVPEGCPALAPAIPALCSRVRVGDMCSKKPCPSGQICCPGDCGGTSCVAKVCKATVDMKGCADFPATDESFCFANSHQCATGQTCCKSRCNGRECTPKTKQGKCPSTKGMVGAAYEECSDDNGCPGEQKCCSNGGGHTCMDPK